MLLFFFLVYSTVHLRLVFLHYMVTSLANLEAALPPSAEKQMNYFSSMKKNKTNPKECDRWKRKRYQQKLQKSHHPQYLYRRHWVGTLLFHYNAFKIMTKEGKKNQIISQILKRYEIMHKLNSTSVLNENQYKTETYARHLDKLVGIPILPHHLWSWLSV